MFSDTSEFEVSGVKEDELKKTLELFMKLYDSSICSYLITKDNKLVFSWDDSDKYIKLPCKIGPTANMDMLYSIVIGFLNTLDRTPSGQGDGSYRQGWSVKKTKIDYDNPVEYDVFYTPLVISKELMYYGK